MAATPLIASADWPAGQTDNWHGAHRKFCRGTARTLYDRDLRPTIPDQPKTCSAPQTGTTTPGIISPWPVVRRRSSHPNKRASGHDHHHPACPPEHPAEALSREGEGSGRLRHAFPKKDRDLPHTTTVSRSARLSLRSKCQRLIECGSAQMYSGCGTNAFQVDVLRASGYKKTAAE